MEWLAAVSSQGSWLVEEELVDGAAEEQHHPRVAQEAVVAHEKASGVLLGEEEVQEQ